MKKRRRGERHSNINPVYNSNPFNPRGIKGYVGQCTLTRPHSSRDKRALVVGVGRCGEMAVEVYGAVRCFSDGYHQSERRNTELARH
jgi:hypothetical protein